MLFAVLAVALTLAVAISMGFGRPAPEATTRARSPSPRSVVCRAEALPLPSSLSGDPCPSATVAVEVAVVPVGLPIDRIAIEPGPFYCDIVWPGVQMPAACYGAPVRPGQFMHAWVSFADSGKVAVVALGLDLPVNLDVPGAARPPWNATLVGVEVPPPGWVMP